MQINLEKKCADLEGQLSWKNKTLDSTAEKLQIARENVVLVVVEKDRQSTEMISFQWANEDLNVQFQNFDRKTKKLESRCRASEEKVGYYKSTEYNTKVVDIYKSSLVFEEELFCEVQHLLLLRLHQHTSPIPPVHLKQGVDVPSMWRLLCWPWI